MKASMAFFLIFLMMFYCVVHTQPVKAAENFWESKAEMPTARGGFGVAVVNGKIYAIGGYNLDSGYLSTNEEYDPATDTWTTKEPMPTPRTDLAIAVYQNKIYVIGGHRLVPSGYEVFGTNEVYDPLTDTWETKTSMPTNRSMLRANVVDGKIYLIGGGYPTYLGIGRRDTNEVYDPLTDSWTTKTPMPTAEFLYASAVVDNKIYVMSYNNLTQIYDPETDTWVFGKPMPTAVSNAAAGATTGVVAPKRIYVIGGGTRFSLSTGLVQVYNPEGDVWDTGTSMPTPRSGLCIAVVNDVLYAIGGSRPPITAVNEQFTPFGYTGVHGTIYIRSDGSIEGTDKIQRDGNVYTFTDNIFNQSIVVEKDNIIVYGASYTLQGTGSGNGISLVDRSNVTVKNMQLMYFYNGIDRPKSNNTFYANYIANNVNGIWGGVSNNNFIGNTIENNTENGISLLFGANNNTISGNKITNNSVGIYYWLSGHDLISENNITANGFGIQVNAGGENNIIKNNITNNDQGISLSSSSNNRIHGNHITKNYDPGIYLWKSSNTLISKNNITDNTIDGIHLFLSSNNNVSQNNINNNGNGIWISDSSNNNISENRITNNCGGIHLEASSNNIYENNITNNIEGIFVGGASNNIIHHNNFINNTKQVYDIAWAWWAPDDETPSVNIWDDGYPSGGNYWSDYEDRYPDAKSLDGLGIWDTPCVLDEDNQDNYPLMHYWGCSTQHSKPFPITWILAAIVIMAVVGAAFLVHFRKIKKTTGKAEIVSEGVM